ncbi:hypothetical protein AFULGI_00017010 [Archaeoglobus fulgidus DSM 8774]|jgi:DNA-binding HxlR family transcriptional regulator|uniref:ArnR1-like winged helix-turn-helix domain-containing protein n=1 Tax=Archaeoglobus fulgidus DSM 8774 TaxID=1344584 RepID=A0A075WDF9_ARCFL|nr:winged helix-turn-helix domain-containing protein [Archaeoglobus fulgidus]AIG98460.1 hypothetical protein AFULGI_00017010 [Archaeoglobus fulgidus DSM 8774]
MPKKEKKSVLDYLDSYALQIMKPLKNGETTYSDLMIKSKLVRSNFNKRLGELLKLKLVRVAYSESKRRPFYSLTPAGKRILELLEEIERVYSEQVGELVNKQ